MLAKMNGPCFALFARLKTIWRPHHAKPPPVWRTGHARPPHNPSPRSRQRQRDFRPNRVPHTETWLRRDVSHVSLAEARHGGPARNPLPHRGQKAKRRDLLATAFLITSGEQMFAPGSSGSVRPTVFVRRELNIRMYARSFQKYLFRRYFCSPPPAFRRDDPHRPGRHASFHHRPDDERLHSPAVAGCGGCAGGVASVVARRGLRG